MAAGTPNYTFAEALNAYNNDQVMTQTMWYILVSPPLKYKGPDLKQMQIYGTNFTVPARTNDFADVSYRGYNIPTPTVLKMDQDHSVTINCDVHHQLRRGFLDWQACAIDPAIKTQKTSFASDRRPTAGVGTGQLQLNLLAPDYETVEMIVTMNGVRVQNVGPITLSNSDGGIATFEVGFKSVFWNMEYPKDNNAEAPTTVDLAGGRAAGGDYQIARKTGPMKSSTAV